MTSFEFQQTRTLVPANVMAPRKEKKNKNQTKKERKWKKKRKNTYLIDGVPVEGFAPHERRTPLQPSLHLRERTSPQLK